MSKPFEIQPPKYDSFPLISSFDRSDMDRAAELLEEDVLYQEQEHAVKEARSSIKAELAQIAARNECDREGGFRHGQIAVYYKPHASKRTFSKVMALEMGYITAGQIEECTVKGKEYVELKVVDLSKPKGAKKDNEWED